MNESLISTILYLYNHPNFRRYVRRRVGLEVSVFISGQDTNYKFWQGLRIKLGLTKVGATEGGIFSHGPFW